MISGAAPAAEQLTRIDLAGSRLEMALRRARGLRSHMHRSAFTPPNRAQTFSLVLPMKLRWMPRRTHSLMASAERGAYRKPREINWLIGVTLFMLGMLEGLFGYSLPDDQLSSAACRILEGVVQGVPIVGTYGAYFLFGGPFPGNSTRARPTTRASAGPAGRALAVRPCCRRWWRRRAGALRTSCARASNPPGCRGRRR